MCPKIRVESGGYWHEGLSPTHKSDGVTLIPTHTMIEVPAALFDLHALSLPAGLAFGDDIPIGAWRTEDSLTLAALLVNESAHRFGALIMRRREDYVWAVKQREMRSESEAAARALIETALVEGAAPEAVPPGMPRRPSLGDLSGVTPSNIFALLANPTHHVAAWVLNQLYLALPRPDPNWARDCQTGNFHTRLWEAHLLACFREQGLRVTQDFPSPDFHITNRRGGQAWIEAVTANPPIPYDHANAPPVPEPATRQERLIGPAAVRFAKTLHNKLARRYHELPHVVGKPFAIALADFHAPASMVWSRAALPSYLYGQEAKIRESDGRIAAYHVDIGTLLGPESIPAGLFRSAAHAELSAVLFSNGCSISKLNRVGISGGANPNGFRYIRFGEFFDRTPGALNAVPFRFDVASSEYRELWRPYPYEPWSAELEVFHNPYARHPIPDALLPEATHWRMRDGEVACSAFYPWSILRSRTLVLRETDPIPRLEDLFQSDHD